MFCYVFHSCDGRRGVAWAVFAVKVPERVGGADVRVVRLGAPMLYQPKFKASKHPEYRGITQSHPLPHWREWRGRRKHFYHPTEVDHHINRAGGSNYPIPLRRDVSQRLRTHAELPRCLAACLSTLFLSTRP